MAKINIVFLLCTIFCEWLCAGQAKSYPIDIVYTWVDGNDPVWLAQKEYYLLLELAQKNISTNKYHALQQEYIHIQHKKTLAIDSITNSRFADHEELRYSLRSVWMYAPWIHHIYIVTMGQKPAWLRAHPKISIIDHTEIFPNPADLPTFNSHAIESNLHRIPGLAEHFVYLNDDVFFGAQVAPGDFFTKKGTMIVLFEKGLTVSPSAEINATGYRKAWKNTNAYLDAHYKKEKRRRLSHAPFALRRSYIESSELVFPQIFISNSSHKFRCDEDYNLINGLLQYHWLYHDHIKKELGFTKNRMVSVQGGEFLEKTRQDLAQLLADLLPSFCLQDVLAEDDHEARVVLKQFLEHYYPVKAPWEQ